MTLKKKILVAALAAGTILGFGSGIRHLKHHHGACHRAAWSQAEQESPCAEERGWQRWQHPSIESRRGPEPPRQRP